MSDVEVRPARETDLDQLAEIHACAYPEAGGSAYHARCLTHNAFGGLELVRVAELGGRVVGHAALFPLELWLGGHRVPAGGIGSLAVAPEARRRGVSRALLGALHSETRAAGGAIALLYPFEQRFYASQGYAAVSPLLALQVETGALARLPSFGPPPDRQPTVIRLDGSHLDDARHLYEEAASSSNGRIVRSESYWNGLVARERSYWMGVVSEEGRLDGYVSFFYDDRALRRDQTLVVGELTARSPWARREILLALGRQRDQVATVELTIPYGDPLAMAIEDVAGPRRRHDHASHPLGTLVAGPMVHLVDLRLALTLRGYAADGALSVICTDGERANVSFSVRDGVARLLEDHQVAGPELRCSRATLGSIVASGLRPAEGAELGLVHGSPAALVLAEEMFAGSRFQCLDPF